jgi:hypothetical protein
VKPLSTTIAAAALVVAPVGLSTHGLVEKNASAVATYRLGAMKPHSTRTYTAGGELRVCNDGPVPVRLFITDSLSDAQADSLLEPGRCNQNWGHMMYVVNDSGCPGGCLGVRQSRRPPRSGSPQVSLGIRRTRRMRRTLLVVNAADRTMTPP